MLVDVSVRDLCGRIAVALNLVPATGENDIVSDANLIATYERRGLRCPIFLAVTPEEDRFATILREVGCRQGPALVVTPTPRRIGRSLRELSAANNVSVIALSDVIAVAGGGVLVCTRPTAQLLPSAAARALGQTPIQDGVQDRKRIVLEGVEHRCDLKEREFVFLQAAWGRDEIRLDEMIHPKHGLIRKARFANSPTQRNGVSSFLKDLNINLRLESHPPLPFSYRLPKGADSVVRDTHQ